MSSASTNSSNSSTTKIELGAVHLVKHPNFALPKLSRRIKPTKIVRISLKIIVALISSLNKPIIPDLVLQVMRVNSTNNQNHADNRHLHQLHMPQIKSTKRSWNNTKCNRKTSMKINKISLMNKKKINTRAIENHEIYLLNSNYELILYTGQLLPLQQRIVSLMKNY